MRRYLPFKFVAPKIAVLCVLLSACVTINVYFPAAAAEKAADRIIEDIWGPSQQPTGTDRPAAPQTSIHAPMQRILVAAAGSVLELLVPAAHAQADLNIATPAVRAITQSMEARHSQLKPYYDSGAVGFTSDGLIEVRDQNLIPLPERNNARKLVTDENSDRTNLYREIAAANGRPDWEADIRKTFAQRWVDRAAGGWYYRDGGAWKQK